MLLYTYMTDNAELQNDPETVLTAELLQHTMDLVDQSRQALTLLGQRTERTSVQDDLAALDEFLDIASDDDKHVSIHMRNDRRWDRKKGDPGYDIEIKSGERTVVLSAYGGLTGSTSLHASLDAHKRKRSGYDTINEIQNHPTTLDITVLSRNKKVIRRTRGETIIATARLSFSPASLRNITLRSISTANYTYNGAAKNHADSLLPYETEDYITTYPGTQQIKQRSPETESGQKLDDAVLDEARQILGLDALFEEFHRTADKLVSVRDAWTEYRNKQS